MSALSGLCPLRHFDLNFGGAAKICAGNAESARRHLLDGAVLFRAEPGRVFASLSGVGFAAKTVHGYRHAGVSLLGDRAVGHRPGLEAFYYLACGFNLLKRHAPVLVPDEFQQTAQGVRLAFVVHHCGVFLEFFVRAAMRRLTQRYNGLGIVKMILGVLAGAQLVDTNTLKRLVNAKPQRIKRLIVTELHALADLLKTYALNGADGICKVFVNYITADAHSLEYLRRLIRL